MNASTRLSNLFACDRDVVRPDKPRRISLSFFLWMGGKSSIESCIDYIAPRRLDRYSLKCRLKLFWAARSKLLNELTKRVRNCSTAGGINMWLPPIDCEISPHRSMRWSSRYHVRPDCEVIILEPTLSPVAVRGPS